MLHNMGNEMQQSFLLTLLSEPTDFILYYLHWM